MGKAIKIFRPTNRRDQWDADENTPRTKIYEAYIPQKLIKERVGKEVAELMFHALNAPEEILNEMELEIANHFRSPGNYSLSTGDVVEVDGVSFLCESFGWKEIA